MKYKIDDFTRFKEEQTLDGAYYFDTLYQPSHALFCINYLMKGKFSTKEFLNRCKRIPGSSVCPDGEDFIWGFRAGGELEIIYSIFEEFEFDDFFKESVYNDACSLTVILKLKDINNIIKDVNRNQLILK